MNEKDGLSAFVGGFFGAIAGNAFDRAGARVLAEVTRPAPRPTRTAEGIARAWDRQRMTFVPGKIRETKLHGGCCDHLVGILPDAPMDKRLRVEISYGALERGPLQIWLARNAGSAHHERLYLYDSVSDGNVIQLPCVTLKLAPRFYTELRISRPPGIGHINTLVTIIDIEKP